MLKDVSVNQIQTKLTSFLDKGFVNCQVLLQLHGKNQYKNYCYDLPYPIEKDKVYKKGNIYTVTIRTIDVRLAKYFNEVCTNNYTEEIKGLTTEIKIIPKKVIESLYTLTPAVLKDEKGYWKTHMTLNQFEERLKVNLIKKWNDFEKEKIPENFSLYTFIKFYNDRPIAIEYKNIKLLGDKIQLQIADNELAQRLAYMALGTGICEMNSRGYGFVNYRWL